MKTTLSCILFVLALLPNAATAHESPYHTNWALGFKDGFVAGAAPSPATDAQNEAEASTVGFSEGFIEGFAVGFSTRALWAIGETGTGRAMRMNQGTNGNSVMQPRGSGFGPDFGSGFGAGRLNHGTSSGGNIGEFSR